MAGLVDVKAEKRAALVAAMLEHIERVHGVETAGAGTGLPPETAQRSTKYEIVGMAKPEQPQYAYFLAVTPNYLPALRTPLLAGRQFGPQDTLEAPKVVIISENLARDRFGNRNPIGEQLKVVNMNQEPDARTIVGVVADVRYNGLDDTDAPAVYTPYPQNPQLLGGIYLMVRTSEETAAVMDGIRNAALVASPGLYVVNMKSMSEIVSDTVSTPRLNTSLLAMFAALAVVLSATGIYGLIGYSVTQRLHEIGIRMALGAKTSDVILLVMRQGLVVVAIGIMIGIGGGVASSRVLRTMLFENPDQRMCARSCSSVLDWYPWLCWRAMCLYAERQGLIRWKRYATSSNREWHGATEMGATPLCGADRLAGRWVEGGSRL